MPEYVLRPGDLAPAFRRLSGNLRKAVERGMISAAHRGRAILVRATPVNTGQLKAAWLVVIGGWLAGFIAEVVNDAPHAGVIEAGARPHAVSRAGVEAIRRWVMLKMFGWMAAPMRRLAKREARATATLSRHRANRAASLRAARAIGASQEAMGALNKEVDRVVWGIVGKLKREGQKPTYFVRRSLPRLKRALKVEVEAAMALVGR